MALQLGYHCVEQPNQPGGLCAWANVQNCITEIALQSSFMSNENVCAHNDCYNSGVSEECDTL